VPFVSPPAAGRRGRAAVLAAVVLLAAAFVSAPLPRAAQNAASTPCELQTKERIVAVADVHGAHDKFVAILRAAGLIDSRQRWTGGRAVLVQTGDILDRGADSRKTLDLLRRLEGEAARAGGKVHALLGNHEVMRMIGDLRYVSAQEYSAFRGLESDELRERVYARLVADNAARAKVANQPFDASAFRKLFFEQTPLGSVEMQIEFGPKGVYGSWLRTQDTMVKINGIVFLHGGVSPAVAAMGCVTVNQTVRSELSGPLGPLTPELVAKLLAPREDGPLWYRGLAQEDETTFAKEVDAILTQLGAHHIVVGHTVTPDGRVKSRFNGRVIQIDTGMLNGDFYPNGRASALEIKDGQFTAIYEDGKDILK
jgi:hypothetical protein